MVTDIIPLDVWGVVLDIMYMEDVLNFMATNKYFYENLSPQISRLFIRDRMTLLTPPVILRRMSKVNNIYIAPFWCFLAEGI